MDSILTTIKQILGIIEEYTYFDSDLIIHINSIFSVLNQLGIGPENGFSISDKTTKWSDYLSDDDLTLNMVKTYISLKVRLLFDPPQGSALIDAIEKQIAELEWRLNVQVDPGDKEETNNEQHVG